MARKNFPKSTNFLLTFILLLAQETKPSFIFRWSLEKIKRPPVTKQCHSSSTQHAGVMRLFLNTDWPPGSVLHSKAHYKYLHFTAYSTPVAKSHASFYSLLFPNDALIKTQSQPIHTKLVIGPLDVGYVEPQQALILHCTYKVQI